MWNVWAAAGIVIGWVGFQTLVASRNGSFHATETITSTARFVPDDPSQPTYTGHFAEWDGFNTNAKNVTGTVTFDAVAHGSDGSLLKVHTLDRLTVNANGTVTSSIEADKLTCP